MYENIITICWSIKEVNRNLVDRESLLDYSINYLNKACSVLSERIISGEGIDLDEEIVVVDRAGQSRQFALREIAQMLNDAKKIIEFNLIDHVDRWARSKNN